MDYSTSGIAEGLAARMTRIKAFVFDVDGVFTDGRLHVMADGDQVRQFHIRDGYAVRKAIEAGFTFAVISGADNPGVRKRLDYLGVPYIWQGVKDKLVVFREFMKEHDLSPEEIMYAGDDLPDASVMASGVLAVCPADAVAEIKGISHWVLPRRGGQEAVRLAVETVMKAQRRWPVVE